MTRFVYYITGAHWFTEALWNIAMGSILTISLILIVRLLFGRILSAKSKYLLWLLLMLRLCMLELPESQFSLLNLEVFQESSINSAIVAAEREGTNIIVEPDGDVLSLSDLRSSAETLPSPLLIWFCGSLIFGGYYAAATIMAQLRLKRAIDVDDPETLHTLVRIRGRLGITREVRLCYGNQALIGGLRRPTMMIPRELSGKKLEAALTHELMHYRSGDLWIIAIQRALCCIHWFNPLVWLSFAWARRDCEKACDQRVLEQDGIDADIYAELLYEEGKMKRPVLPGTSAFGRSNLKGRIRLITRFRRPLLAMTVLAGTLGALILMTTLTGQVTPKKILPDLTVYQFYIHGAPFEFTESGQQTVVKYSVKPASAEIYWSVEDTSVATVDEYGVITAVAPGTTTLHASAGATAEIICDFTVDVTSSCPERDMLEYFFTIPNEELWGGFAEREITGNNDAIKSVLEAAFSDRYSTQFELSFLAGNKIGKLWRYAYENDFSVSLHDLVIIQGMEKLRYDYEAQLVVTSAGGNSQNLKITGELTYDTLGRVNSITVSGQEIRQFFKQLEEQEVKP